MEIRYFREEEGVRAWFDLVKKHILTPDSIDVFELPSQFQQKDKQIMCLDFLKSGVGSATNVDNNILLIMPSTRKVVETVEFQIGEGSVQTGLYIPYLPLKPNTQGNRSVELSTADLSRVREDKVIQ